MRPPKRDMLQNVRINGSWLWAWLFTPEIGHLILCLRKRAKFDPNKKMRRERNRKRGNAGQIVCNSAAWQVKIHLALSERAVQDKLIKLWQQTPSARTHSTIKQFTASARRGHTMRTADSETCFSDASFLTAAGEWRLKYAQVPSTFYILWQGKPWAWVSAECVYAVALCDVVNSQSGASEQKATAEWPREFKPFIPGGSSLHSGAELVIMKWNCAAAESERRWSSGCWAGAQNNPSSQLSNIPNGN